MSPFRSRPFRHGALALAALCVGSCQQGTTLPGSGSVDGMDLGLELGLDLQHLAQAATQPGTALLADVAERTDLAVVEPARIYEAKTRLGEEEVALRIAVLSLPEGGRLAVAVDPRGEVRASALWGSAELDTDPDGAWRTFRFQFHNGSETLNLEGTFGGAAQVDAYWRALENDPSPDAEVARALYRHRILMSANSHYVRAMMRRSARGMLPPRSWVLGWKQNFREVAELSPKLAGAIGRDAAEKHERLAFDAVTRLDEISLALDAEEPRSIRNIVTGSFRHETCQACHSIRSGALGGDELREGIRNRFEELGVRRDVRRVGWDVWPVPGQETMSQHAANAYKAAFLLLGELAAD